MKKPVFSRITTWTIRILCAVIVIIGLILMALSAMGGTGEYHRQGLQQALSDSLKSDVKIGALDEFNIFPQLAFQAREIHGVSKVTKTEFMIDKMRIAFGFSDLAMSRRVIEDFQIDNLRFSTDSPYDFHLTHGGIKKSPASAFEGVGQFEGRKIDFSMPLTEESDGRKSYHFKDKNDFSGHLGSLEFKGTIAGKPGEGAVVIENIVLTSAGKQVAKGQGIRKDGAVEIDLSCEGAISSTMGNDIKILRKIPDVKLDQSCPK